MASTTLQTKKHICAGMTGDGHHVCMLGISLEETERVFPLADAASATRHPASAVRSYHLPKADGVRGGVRVKQLFILGNVPQGEKAHVLHLFRASAGDHLSGREARTWRAGDVSLCVRSMY